ncbi:MAG TPA: hypothetical protein VHE55_03440 [Fimbriimonadaceae bacterium]|nr:hypothetical protein [Fimbriimonadaceae bacterium]
MTFEVNREQLRQHSPVRVTIPASVAYHLPSLQNGIANIMNHLGCGTCCSGIDVSYMTEREFVLNEKLEVSSLAGRIEPNPSPWKTTTIAVKASANIDQIKRSIANAAGRLGCQGCCSGFDIHFRNEVELMS